MREQRYSDYTERQSSIWSKCKHPTGEYIEIKEDELDQSIASRFEQQVRKYPERLAIKSRNYEFTYHELNKSANRIARAILRLSREVQEPIVILMEHDAPAIVAILGVLKAGKFYVPLSTSYPIERLAYIIEDSQTPLIVTNNKNIELARELIQGKTQLINIDHLDPNTSSENPGLYIPTDSYAYIIYTSGSTGQPKGVIESQRNVLHFTKNWAEHLHICAEDRMSLIFPLSFSGSTTSVFPCLLNGASLFPFDVKSEEVDKLADWLIKNEITIYSSVPTMFRHFAETLTGKEEFPHLRAITIGGDKSRKTDLELYKKHFSHNCTLRFGYGTSEVKLISFYLIDHNTQITDNLVPVGYRVKNVEVMILDDNGEDVGFNKVGQIAVKSRYVSPGYWRKPELTKAKFIPDPDSRDKWIYLTGDMGYMLPDGCLIHLGREDFQFKIRGHLIDVGEIEWAILNSGKVKETAVVTREDNSGYQRLIAYVVPATQPSPTVSELRRILSEKLPDYMIPSVFVTLDSIPLNPNGKLDHGALPEPDTKRPELDTPLVSARTPVEDKLANIWSQVLEIDEVGINDNFFDLGGHSLLVTQIISRVIRTFQVKLPLHSLFQSPTIADMAVVITQSMAEKVESVDINLILKELESILVDTNLIQKSKGEQL